MGYIPLDKTKHQNFGFKSDTALKFAQEWSFLPLSSVELHQYISQVPICFQKQGDNFQLGLPTGLYEGTNVFIHPQNHKFLLSAVPAILRRYPFNASQVNADGKVVFLVLEEEKDFKHLTQDYILDSNGESTDRGKEYLSFLLQLNKQFEEDKKVVDLISSYDLLTPMNIQIKNSKDDTIVTTRGDLYQIDESRLKTLSGDELYELNALGAFHIIYASIISMKCINNLFNITQNHAKLKIDEVDVDDFFAQNNDTISFDW